MKQVPAQISPLIQVLFLVPLMLISTITRAIDYTDDYPLSDDELYDNEYCPEEFWRKLAEPEVKKGMFSFLDPHQEAVSDYVRELTTSIDKFFANTEKYDDHTGSYMQLVFDTTWKEAGDLEFDPGLKFRLRLPQTQKKLRLVIESDPEEKQDTRQLETRNIVSNTENDTRTGLYTGIESDISKSEKWKIRPSLGIRIRSPLDYYVRLRASRENYYDKWKLYLNETLYWFDSTGFGADTTMEWDRLITKKLIFRSTSFVRYTDERDQFDMSQSLNLIHQISENRSIAYKAAVFGDTEPAIYATSYLLNIRYRQNLHKDYLFFEIQPSIIYEKETAWEAQHELFLRLELFYRG